VLEDCAPALEAQLPAVESQAPNVADRFNQIREGAEKVAAVVRMPNGENLFVQGRDAATLATPEAADLLQRLNLYDEWWWEQVQATSNYRDTLPTVVARQDFMRRLMDIGEELFGLK